MPIFSGGFRLIKLRALVPLALPFRSTQSHLLIVYSTPGGKKKSAPAWPKFAHAPRESKRKQATAIVIVPIWSAELRELRLGLARVKRFRQPAKNQDLILAAFQDENWAVHSDDPVPGGDNQDAQDRLHDAVRRLNQQKEPLIRFMPAGLGKGITWERNRGGRLGKISRIDFRPRARAVDAR